MAEFSQAINLVMGNEGGFINHPSDPGGATNFGISMRFLKSLGVERLRKYGFFDDLTVKSIEEMSHDQAIAIYFGEFWEPIPLFKIQNQDIANYVFDCCVHHGQSRGIKILQRALWAAYKKKGIVADDGILGNKTLGAIGVVTPYLLSCLMAERAGYIRSIANGSDGSDISEEFINGWLNRAYRF